MEEREAVLEHCSGGLGMAGWVRGLVCLLLLLWLLWVVFLCSKLVSLPTSVLNVTFMTQYLDGRLRQCVCVCEAGQGRPLVPVGEVSVRLDWDHFEVVQLNPGALNLSVLCTPLKSLTIGHAPLTQNTAGFSHNTTCIPVTHLSSQRCLQMYYRLITENYSLISYVYKITKLNHEHISTI